MSYEWIIKNDSCAENGLITVIEQNISEGLYVAFYTHEIKGGYFSNGSLSPEVVDFEHLLEIRVFNPNEELKMIRSQMGNDFIWRLASEKGLGSKLSEITFTEVQYLDIDDTKMSGEIEIDYQKDGITIFHATGGGKYGLPVSPEAKKVKIINYLNYDYYGNVCVDDFRIAGFLTEKEGALYGLGEK